MLDFRILGPLEVWSDGQAVELGGPKQRTLLAALLLEANRVVSSDRLNEAIWEEDPPSNAQKALQIHVTHLRKALSKDRVQTKAPGYLLLVEEGELDVERFEALLAAGRRALADGRPAAAAESLEQALALWRGSPLADLADEPFARVEIARLEEARLTAREDLIESELALGGHNDLIGRLDAIVAANPLRERLRGQHMLALYRSGRQAEALASYQEVRHLLTDELGLEPGDPLKALQRAILAHDPALQSPAPMDTAPPEATPAQVFVGRGPEVAELLAGLEHALAGRGRLFLVSGDPGIGKSRLAEHLAGNARQRGAVVLVGRCWEAGGAPAYWPWVQALRGYLRGRDPEVIRSLLGHRASDLAQIVPEVKELYADLAPPPVSEPEAARFRLFDATASFLAEAAQVQPIVLVLDDLHAADTPSLLLLQFLAASLAVSRLLVLGAFRDVDPTLKDPLSATLTELAREPVTRRLALTGLHEAEVAEFVALTTATDSSSDVAAAIHRETEGNPLFVGEIVRLLVTEGALEEATSASAWQLTVPEGVRAVIRRRLRHLSEDCMHVLVLASVLGREFSLDALGQASGVGGDALLDVLDEAARERVVAAVPGVSGRLRFAHALIRDTLYEELAPGRRVQLERRVGEALETLYANDPEPYLAELAHHFLAAAPAGAADEAVEYARRAGDRAVGLLAFEEAVRLFEAALAVRSDDSTRCELLLALGDAQTRAGDTPGAKATFRSAAELATAQRLSTQLALAALGYGGRLIWEVSRDDEYLVPLLEQALAALGDEDSILRVRLLGRFAAGPLRDASFPPERRAVLSREGLAMARRIGDPATVAYALAAFISARHTPDHTRQQIELATELIAVATAAGERERAVEGHEHRSVALLELGDLAGAQAELALMSKLADELRQPSQQWLVAELRAQQALLQGRLAEAEELIAEAFALGERAQAWNANVSYLLQLFLLRSLQGRLDEVEEALRASAARYPTYPIYRCAHLYTVAALGREPEARLLLDELAADDFAGLPFDETWLVSLSLISEIVNRFADAQRAAVLYERLHPYADRIAGSYAEICTGSVSRHLGLLASTLSRPDDAISHFEGAIAANERVTARPALAQSQEDLARLLAGRGHRGDEERAAGLFDQAVATYAELGMCPAS